MTDVADRPRRTQAERSAATRGRLLDATIDALVELGYASTTTTVIAERAGVSRGAQLHHFPAKADLVASAVEHLAEKRMEQVRDEARRLRGRRDRVKRALDLLWESHRGPLFHAALELWIVARTDPDLREKLAGVERKLTLSLYELSRELFGEDIVRTRKFNGLLAMALSLMQGLTLIEIHEIEEHQLDRAWTFYRDELASLFER